MIRTHEIPSTDLHIYCDKMPTVPNYLLYPSSAACMMVSLQRRSTLANVINSTQSSSKWIRILKLGAQYTNMRFDSIMFLDSCLSISTRPSLYLPKCLYIFVALASNSNMSIAELVTSSDDLSHKQLYLHYAIFISAIPMPPW